MNQARAFMTRVALLISLTGLAAAQAKQVVPGPIPTQIQLAKKVFIANAGGDEPGIDEPIFSGGVDRSYNPVSYTHLTLPTNREV